MTGPPVCLDVTFELVADGAALYLPSHGRPGEHVIDAARPATGGLAVGGRTLILDRAASTVPYLVGPGMVAPLAAANGGYFPTAWGWSALVLLWVAALALLLRRDVRLGRLELTALAAVAGLAAWTLASYAWTSSKTQTVLEVERTLVYVGGMAVALLVARRRSYGALLTGAWAAVTVVCVYSLLTRLFPGAVGGDSIAGYRLATPIGYWNSLGLFAGMGALLALGFAARARSLPLRALAAASIPILLPTLYFTFSRGAWMSIGVGLVAAVAVDPRRLQLLGTSAALAPWAAVAVAVGATSHGLTHIDATLAEATRQGHRLAWVIAVLAVCSAGAAVLAALAGRRVTLGRAQTRALEGALALVLAIALVAIFVGYRSPSRLATTGYHSFVGKGSRSANLNTHLFSFNGSNRAPEWHAAWREYVAHPVLGGGAGSYEENWLQHRPNRVKVRDAHNLYLEKLAELGPLGLALVVVMLGAPLLAVRRARRASYAPLALGAYVAFLLHASADWDWELPAVTLLALVCGASLLIAARGKSTRSVRPTWRIGGAAVASLLGVAAFFGLVGNLADASSTSAAGHANWAKARSQARRAATWAPWSSEPWRLLGEAELATGDDRSAIRSFRKAIAKDPRNWQLWFDLARTGDGALQRRALAEAARLDPLSPEIAELRAENAALGGGG